MLTDPQLLYYLEKIGYFPKGHADRKKNIAIAEIRKSPSTQVMNLLPRLQLTTIPYETISLHWRPVLQSADESPTGAPVLLSPPMGITPADVYSKLVAQSRGGYCLEMNCLLGYAFQSLGFLVDRVTAKMVCDIKAIAKRAASLVGEGANNFTSEELVQMEAMPADVPGWETHQMLLVALPSDPTHQYLVDIGLAKYSIRAPILLTKLSSEVHLTRSPGVMGTQLRVWHDPAQPEANRWNVSIQWLGCPVYFPLYTFQAQAADPAQIEMIHYYMSLSPRSCDPPEMFATMYVEGLGQVSLQGMELTIVDIDRWGSRQVERTVLESEEEQEACFRKYFGIEGYKLGAMLVKE